METYKLTYQIGTKERIIIKHSIHNLVRRCCMLRKIYGRFVKFGTIEGTFT